jgi:ABC-2 type transport system ATP-binding protein
MDAVVEEPMTVVLSSHLIADLERVCDHLMVLRSGQVQTFGATDELLATHKLLVGPSQRRRPKLAGVEQIVSATKAERQMQLLVRTSGEILDPAWDQYDISLEDLVLAYLAERAGEPLLDLEAAGA